MDPSRAWHVGAGDRHADGHGDRDDLRDFAGDGDSHAGAALDELSRGRIASTTRARDCTNGRSGKDLRTHSDGKHVVTKQLRPKHTSPARREVLDERACSRQALEVFVDACLVRRVFGPGRAYDRGLFVSTDKTTLHQDDKTPRASGADDAACTEMARQMFRFLRFQMSGDTQDIAHASPV